MQYQELNIFNTAFIPPFTEKRPISLYAREDIIDTEKVLRACATNVEWKLVEYQDNVFFSTWIPLPNRSMKLKHGIVHQLGVYVLTDTPSMFETVQRGHAHEWLPHHWDKMFLMTTPVLKYVPKSSSHSLDMHIDYFVPNTYPLQKVLLPDHSVHTTWIDMLQARSYTIGNGMTLFLTMIKSGNIPAYTGKTCIQRLFQQYGVDMFQPVHGRWMELCYGHPTMHVCDSPCYYAAMGNPSVPYDIFELFSISHDDDVLMNIANGNNRIISTLRSVILTQFRPEWWERVMGTAWYECPLHIRVEDEYDPNLASFFLAMVRTKVSWKWWLAHQEEYLESLHALLSKYHAPIPMLEHMIQPVLHLYEHAQEYTPTLCYSRLRHLWQAVLRRFDPECKHLMQLIQRWSLRCTFIHVLKTGGYISQPGWEFEAPVAFLKDVVEIYGETCDLYRRIPLRIYSEYDQLIARTYPELHYDTALRSNFHTIKVLQLAPAHTTFHIFYKTFVLPRIESRLAGIYHGFGMLENRMSSVPSWRKVGGLHTVGFLVLEHLREHRDMLYA